MMITDPGITLVGSEGGDLGQMVLWGMVALLLLAGSVAASSPPLLLVARYSREKDFHPGGVPKFAWLFKQCFPEAEEVVVSDLPFSETEGKGEPALTEALGEWVQSRYRSRAPVVIADGYWGRGLPSHWRVICVAHGTWEAIGWRTDSNMTRNIPGQLQAEEYQRREEIVSVSWAVYRQLKHFAGRESQVILNGVDTEKFYPAARKGRPILHVASTPNKGLAMVEELQDRFSLEYLDAAIGQEPTRFRRGRAFFHPSRSEGNSYAVLEALATGLPCCLAAVGLAEDLPPSVAEVVWEHQADAYAEGLKRTLSGSYQGRAWVERYASLPVWREQWERVLHNRK